MSDVAKVGRLEIDQDLAAQARDWRAQRVGWWCMLLLVVGGALGIFGGGPLATAKVAGRGGTVRYERFARLGAPATLTVTLPARAGTLQLSINRAYLDRIQIEQITPEPAESRVQSGSVSYSFHVAPAKREPARIVFETQPGRVGLARGRIETGGQTLTFRQLVYP